MEETISLLIAEKIPLEGLQVKSPNLDDLFLKLTGHSLRE
ncbi:MAG: ABC-2 type transport system ATP-binding protein [Colwellia sp.]